MATTSNYHLMLMLGPIFLVVNCILYISVTMRTTELNALKDVTVEVQAIKDGVEKSLEKLNREVYGSDKSSTSVNTLEERTLPSNEAGPIEKEVEDSLDTEAEKTEPEQQEAPEAPEAPEATFDLSEWKTNVCNGGEYKSSICHEVFVLPNKKVTFCSAAKVASTTVKQYFYDISDGALKIPEGAKFGAHEADWKKLQSLDPEARRFVLRSDAYTHVFFWKNVLARFVSGYLDKVVHDCEQHATLKPHLAITHYVQYGFSCDEHKDLASFVEFMENVPSFEGHFAAQTPLCEYGVYPFTDVIEANESLDTKLVDLSAKLGVAHPESETEKTAKHKTGAAEKMASLFKGREGLIPRILNLFAEDCKRLPEACDVKELMDALEKEE